ncbi:hypothetical protein ABZ208_31130 [Streptomyces sp. NPDC006208]|uniref:hypothetical protein n=1 Tax=Streptomyces sp. NPDC006208 TaxID=3156734 RepID=UPI0033B56AB3
MAILCPGLPAPLELAEVVPISAEFTASEQHRACVAAATERHMRTILIRVNEGCPQALAVPRLGRRDRRAIPTPVRFSRWQSMPFSWACGPR